MLLDSFPEFKNYVATIKRKQQVGYATQEVVIQANVPCIYYQLSAYERFMGQQVKNGSTHTMIIDPIDLNQPVLASDVIYITSPELVELTYVVKDDGTHIVVDDGREVIVDGVSYVRNMKHVVTEPNNVMGISEAIVIGLERFK